MKNNIILVVFALCCMYCQDVLVTQDSVKRHYVGNKKKTNQSVVKSPVVHSRCSAFYQSHGNAILLCCCCVTAYVALYCLIFKSMHACGALGVSSSSSCQADTIMED